MTTESSGSQLRVLIHGVSGRMGGETLAAVRSAPDMIAVGGVDVRESSELAADFPFYTDVGTAIEACAPDVMVDFSIADVSPAALRAAVERGVHGVAGTTGIPDAELQAIDALAKEKGVGVFIAPNFAIGAVLLVQISRTLSRFFEVAEIVEAHHDAKIDAPSGTALAIAHALGRGPSGAPGAADAAAGARPGQPRRGGRRRVDSRATHAGPPRTPRGGARHAGADPHPSPRHHRPRVLHAGRSHRHTAGGTMQGSRSRAGEAAQPVDSHSPALLQHPHRKGTYTHDRS